MESDKVKYVKEKKENMLYDIIVYSRFYFLRNLRAVAKDKSRVDLGLGKP